MHPPQPTSTDPHRSAARSMFRRGGPTTVLAAGTAALAMLCASVAAAADEFPRRKPGLFLLGAAAAGVLAGRLTSGVKAAHTDTGQHTGGYAATTNYVDPTPTYSETTTTYTGTSAGYSTAGSAPLPPPPYGTVPPEGSMVPPATSTGWEDPARRPGGVG